MKSGDIRPAVVLAVGVVVCVAASQAALAADDQACTLAADDLSAIREMEAAHEAHVVAADWEAMGASMAPSVVAMPPNQPDIVGRDALVAWAGKFPPIAEYDLAFEDVGGCGDLAYVRGRYSMALKPTDSGEVFRDSGRWIWLLRKNAEGHWLVTHDISNSEIPMQAPQ